jgi:hypothetical protein
MYWWRGLQRLLKPDSVTFQLFFDYYFSYFGNSINNILSGLWLKQFKLQPQHMLN